MRSVSASDMTPRAFVTKSSSVHIWCVTTARRSLLPNVAHTPFSLLRPSFPSSVTFGPSTAFCNDTPGAAAGVTRSCPPLVDPARPTLSPLVAGTLLCAPRTSVSLPGPWQAASRGKTAFPLASSATATLSLSESPRCAAIASREGGGARCLDKRERACCGEASLLF